MEVNRGSVSVIGPFAGRDLLGVKEGTGDEPVAASRPTRVTLMEGGTVAVFRGGPAFRLPILTRRRAGIGALVTCV